MAGNPSYSSQAATGFNVTPPPDDGTQVAANLVGWNTFVLGKVGTPLYNFAVAINAAIVTAFAAIRQLLSIQTVKAISFAVSVANDDGRLYLCSTTITGTLPDPASAGAGFRIAFKKTDAAGTTVTVAPFASETIDGLSSIPLTQRYAFVMLVCDGTNWHIAASYLVITSAAAVNYLDNPMGEVYQYGSTSTTDDTYGGCDRWYSLTQSNAITASQGTNAEAGTPFYDRISQANAGAQRMGRATILESSRCRHLRGQTITVQLRAALSSTANIRFAVLEWTGTADAVTSDVVNDWTSSTYTAGNFFISTTTNVLGVSASQSMTAATWADLTSLTITVGAAMNNLIVVYWTEATVAQNVTLDVSRRQMIRGNIGALFSPRAYSEELARCQRYYVRLATASADTDCIGMGYAVSTTVSRVTAALPVTLRAPAAVAITTDGTAGDYRMRRNGDAAVACTSVPALFRVANNTLGLTCTTAASMTAGEGCGFEFTNATGYIGVVNEL